MPSITEYREAYKLNGSFEYPDFFERFKKARKSIWSPDEVSFESDLRNWKEGSEDEKEIIGGILRGFTQLECHVSDYWSKIPEWFPKHEVAAVAREYAASEQVHAWAYNHLSDTLGLDEFEAFLGDPTARQKIGFFLENRSIKESLAVFSGAAEGVSLFSSFAVLLSFNLIGKYRGLCQIISWSALDETEHSNTGISLFKLLCEEDPLTKDEADQIIEGFKLVIKNEFAFIDRIFYGRGFANPRLSKENLKQYIYYRANNRLAALGISGFRFPYDFQAANNIRVWFHPLIKGNTSTDFFSQSKDGSSYIAKPSQDFMAVNLKTLTFDLV
jgi:ribonucleoside-diphosphate reductase beta chain